LVQLLSAATCRSNNSRPESESADEINLWPANKSTTFPVDNALSIITIPTKESTGSVLLLRY
jgi:hypothetical protein